MSIYLGGNNKLKGAYIGKINYRDKQGPCPDGFHVPLVDEVEDLCEYMRQFGLCNREGFKQYLLTPPAGYRMPTDANISGQGSDLYYRTCEVSTTVGRSRCIMAYNNYFIISQYFQSGGASIRPFKNEPAYPDNTWNILYGTIDNGISHNATLGLISIVKGDNIITIADKNLGATTVYNNGDTLSEANCGKYFQRGNNYGFPRTGTITNTSTTKVDASSYGPGNYYYGETYILGTPTWMTSVNSNIWGGTSPNRTPIKRIVIFPDGVTEKQIRPEIIPTSLCFTAEEANSNVRLIKIGNPTVVELEISTDGVTWTDYTIGNTITLANVGDKVYIRNKSETDTGFSLQDNLYQFAMSGKIGASGDITSLLNKNGTTTLSNYCFSNLFESALSLTTTPELPATTLARSCYQGMFVFCLGLTTLPELPATTLADYCYYSMFNGCTKIKLSRTQTGEYQTPYRIPTTGTGTTANYALDDMFAVTGGTVTGTPTINTTYYTSNQVI